MPIRPRNTRSCSTRSSTSSVPNASFGSDRKATAERAQRLAGQLLVRLADLARGAPSSSGRVSSPTSSCEQRASRTSGAPLVKTSRRSCRSASRVDRAHQLALGGERHLADAREARVERLVARARPCARRRSARLRSGSPCTVQRPSRSCSTALLARSAAASARTSSTRSGPSIGAAPVPPHLALAARSRCRRSGPARSR